MAIILPPLERASFTFYTPIAVLAYALLFFIRNALSNYRTCELDEAVGEQHGCLPPPLLENQRPLGVDRLEQIFRANTECRLMELFLFHFRQTGSTLKQKFLLTPAYGTIEPANLEAILSSNFKAVNSSFVLSLAGGYHDWSMGPRRAISFPMFGDGIFTQEGEAWKHSRAILRPQFVHKQYEDLAVFEEAMDDLLNAIQREAGNSGVLDLQPLFFKFTLDTTTSFLFGDSVRSLKASDLTEERTFADAFNTAQELVAKRFRLLGLYWLIGGRKFRESCKKVHAFADEIIDRNLSRDRTEAGQKKYVFLDSLSERTPDRVALRGQIVNILAAGRDTTACLLSWAFFLLVRHPKVLEKLLAEVNGAVPADHARLKRTDLLNMRYLQSVIKETLRLYPSLPVNTRSAIRTTILPTGGGPDRKSPVLIPKGSAVAFSVYSMHRRPDLYGMDAEIFRPERWDEDLPLYRDPTSAAWGYLPFNGGPRICLGMDFALTEAGYAIFRILRHFPQLSLPQGESVELVGVEKQRMTLVVSSANGCNVRINNIVTPTPGKKA